MKTYTIETEKELEQFKDDYGYYVNGNLEVKCSLNIEKRLKVDGYLLIEAGGSIKAGYFIEAGGSIQAGGYIEAGGYIKAGDYIEAGGSIKAGGYIDAGGYIKAGRYTGISAGLQITCKGTLSFGLKCFAGVCTWRTITNEEKTITCEKLIGDGVIEYGILRETSKKAIIDNDIENAIKLLQEKNILGKDFKVNLGEVK
jgi:hypothetical protein